jgi:hypothetical protein
LNHSPLYRVRHFDVFVGLPVLVRAEPKSQFNLTFAGSLKHFGTRFKVMPFRLSKELTLGCFVAAQDRLFPGSTNFNFVRSNFA